MSGPFFDDLAVGQARSAPALTVTSGVVATHQAIVGDRTAATLDHDLAARVFGLERPVVPPGLVIDVAIGQSSVVTRRVRANLFYRGLQLRRLVAVGDTLRTVTEVVALRQNALRPGRPATGLAVLRIRTTDQEGRAVLDFERCAMLPLSGADVETGHAQDVQEGRPDIDLPQAAALAGAWDLGVLAHVTEGPRAAELVPGTTFTVDDADVVSGAPELARLTLNVAAVHHDRRVTGTGQRLVYGGHTIGLAATQAARALPGLAAIVAWHGCDHTGPVLEDDALTSEVTVEAVEPLPASGALVHLRSRVLAHRPEAEPSAVLDWRYVAAVA